MTTDQWHAYVAGFFDGEGSVTLARVRSGGKSDYHLMRITLSQRLKHREVLDRVAETFGGHVTVRSQSVGIAMRWAEQAVWQLQSKPHILVFLQTMEPFCLVKSRQIALGLEFLSTFVSSRAFRDDIGRIHGRVLTADEIERREGLRVQMLALNATGPQKQAPSQLPPLDVQHRRREEEERIADRSSIVRGEGHGRAKLTEESVRAIRRAYAAGSITMDALSVEHGVSFGAIRKIVRLLSWQHVID